MHMPVLSENSTYVFLNRLVASWGFLMCALCDAAEIFLRRRYHIACTHTHTHTHAYTHTRIHKYTHTHMHTHAHTHTHTHTHMIKYVISQKVIFNNWQGFKWYSAMLVVLLLWFTLLYGICYFKCILTALILLLVYSLEHLHVYPYCSMVGKKTVCGEWIISFCFSFLR